MVKGGELDVGAYITSKNAIAVCVKKCRKPHFSKCVLHFHPISFTTRALFLKQ